MILLSSILIILTVIFVSREDVYFERILPQCLPLSNTSVVVCIDVNYSAASTISKNTTKLIWIFTRQKNVTILENGFFGNLSNLHFLTLEQNYLLSIKSEAFEGLKNLKTLYLSDNFISALEKDVFYNCPKLKIIDLSSNRISSLHSVTNSMTVLYNLNSVIFDKNIMLTTITQNDFLPLNESSVKAVSLAYCNIENISPGTFSVLNNLQHLNLSANKLSRDNLWNALVNVSSKLKILDISDLNLKDIYLPVVTLELLSRTEIQELVLDFNPVVYIIRAGDFPFLPTLLKLSMVQCRILWLEDDAFKNLTSLEELNINQNFLPGIYSAIYSLKTLRVLLMSYNKRDDFAFTLGEYNLGNMTSLEVLFLTSVPIGPLRRYALNGLSNLKLLSLDNSVRSIEPYAFESLGNLLMLSLTRNYFTTLHEDSFYGLNRLNVLSLHNNLLILNGSKTYFTHMTNLQMLFLGKNQLTEIPYLDLMRLTNLTTLMIERNQIVPWTVKIRTNKTKGLKILDISYNKLNTITSSMIKDFESMTEFNLIGNPLNCSECDTFNFAQWLNATNKIRRINDTYCIKPENLTGKLLRFIQLPEHCIDDASTKTIYWATGVSVLLFVSVVTVVSGYYFRWFLRYRWFIGCANRRRNVPVMEHDNYLYDAFISYNYKDGNWLTEHLLPQLETGENAMKLCVHERDFEIGKEILNNVIESIDRSRKIILLLSDDFLTSHWCTWEMNMAQFHLADGTRDALILILLGRLDKRHVTSTLRFLLRTQKTLKWIANPHGQKLFFEKLKYFLQRNQRGDHQEDTLV